MKDERTRAQQQSHKFPNETQLNSSYEQLQRLIEVEIKCKSRVNNRSLLQYNYILNIKRLNLKSTCLGF